MLPGSSGGEEDFDVLEPKSWPVEFCFLMGARVSAATHDTLLTFRRMRCIVINAFFLGITQFASVYRMCIQWRLYKATRIWKLKVPLGIGRELFCLTFLLWTVCVGSSPRFCPLYKAPERTTFHIHWPWNSAEVPSFFTLLKQKRCRLNHGRCSWGKENRG